MWRLGNQWPVLVFCFTLLAGTVMAAPAIEQGWERTPDGWRRLPMVQARSRFDSAGLHPLVLAAGQLTMSLFVLAAFPAKLTATGKPPDDPLR
jgi:hypothetical protein